MEVRKIGEIKAELKATSETQLQQFIEKYSNCEKEANRLLGLFENYKLGDANLICQLITSRPYSNMSQENIICYLARKLVLECLEKKTKRILSTTFFFFTVK